MKDLLTEKEVIFYSGVKLQSLKCDFRMIRRTVLYEFRTVLGLGLWKAFTENLNDLSSAENYESGVTYQKDKLVNYKGKVYQASKETSNQPPLNTDWKEPDKFAKECLNSLFCEYGLAEYLSHKILIDRLPHLAVQVGASGAIKQRGQNFEAASLKETQMLVSSHTTQAAICLDNLDWYIKDNKDSDCFSGYLPFEEYCDCCGVKLSDCQNGTDAIHLFKKNDYNVAT